ncbi:MAG: hypothetical protein WCB85_09030, partial [Candidatus Dormiibacterota bacterium]
MTVTSAPPPPALGSVVEQEPRLSGPSGAADHDESRPPVTSRDAVPSEPGPAQAGAPPEQGTAPAQALQPSP